ncbi:PTS ascorbate transporter subunit IIC [Furfurilactobacillus sp. WILCCON 0119]
MKTFLSIIQTPSIIIALVTFLGLLFQRNKPAKIVTGTVISFMGFTMIKMGGAILGQVLTDFSTIFSHAFHIQGVVPSNEAMMALTINKIGGTAAIMLVAALVINILMARWTRFKNIYLSLQMIVFMCFAVTSVLQGLHYSKTATIIIGAIFIGAYMTFIPFALRHYSKKAIGNDDYTIAHSGSIAYIAGAWLGEKFGNKENDAETVELNQSILFLKDSNVATLLTMLILFLVAGLFAGMPYVESVAKGQEFWVYILTQSATFAAGLYVVKAGVKLFINEIVPAFKGFADVFAPGSIAGVDPMVLFDKSPNSALIGFIVTFLVGVACIFIFPFVGLPVIVPGLMACFITGGAAAILGNATGGLRGAIIASAVDGLFLALLPALTLPLFASLGVHGTTFADPDFTSISILIWGIFKWF